MASLSSTAVADLFFVATVVVGLLALAPFRELVSSLWSDAHERVILEGERGYILVETESELVNYRPGSGPARRYVKGEHLELERLGTMGYPFETQEWFEQVRSGGNVPEIDP